jgi:hypothetical protein
MGAGVEIDANKLLFLLGSKEAEIFVLKEQIEALKAALQNVQNRPPIPPEFPQ